MVTMGTLFYCRLTQHEIDESYVRHSMRENPLVMLVATMDTFANIHGLKVTYLASNGILAPDVL